MSNKPELDQESLGQTYIRLLSMLKPYLHLIIASFIGFGLFAASQPALAKLAEILVNALEQKDADARWYIPAWIIGIYVVRGIGSFLGSYYLSASTQSLVHTLRTQVFDHILHLPIAEIENTSRGQLINKVLSYTSLVTQAGTQALKVIVREGLTAIALLSYAFYVNWKMSLTFLVAAPIIGLITLRVSKKFRKLTIKIQDTMR